MSAVGRPNDVKTCTKCGETKPLSEYMKRHDVPSGYRAACRKCTTARKKAWKEKNREKVNRDQRAWYHKNHAKQRAYQKTWRAENRESVNASQYKWNEQNRDKVAATYRRYQKQNPEKVRAITHRRRARKKANGVFTVTDKDLARLYASPCAACGSTHQITADHVIPISRGGHHGIGNLQPLCLSCNASKNDRLMVEWLAA